MLRWEFFEAQMGRMRGMPYAPTDLQTHWEGLHDLSEAVLPLAVMHAIRTLDHFPAPHELRERADIVAHLVPREPDDDRSEALAEPIELGTLPDGTRLPMARRVYRYACDVCSDSGWAPVEPRAVKPCACRETNPVLVRKRERDRRYAEARTARRGA